MSGLSRHAEFRPLSGIGAIIACVVLLVNLVMVDEGAYSGSPRICIDGVEVQDICGFEWSYHGHVDY